MKLKLIFFLNFFLMVAWAQKVSFLIVEHPGALKLLNTYRQEMTDREKRALGKWVPFQLNQVITLSDNVTQAYQVKVLDKSYFLLLDDEGQPINLPNAGKSRYEYRVNLLMDTVRIRPDVQLKLLDPMGRLKIRDLSARQWVVRIFRKYNNYYIALPGSPPIYGIVKISSNRVWEKIKKETFVQEQKIKNFLESLQFLVQNRNQTYQKLFTYFVHKQSLQDTLKWRLYRNQQGITLIFSHPDLLKKWPRSTKLFVEEVTELARQNGFDLSVQNFFTLKIFKRRKQ